MKRILSLCVILIATASPAAGPRDAHDAPQSTGDGKIPTPIATEVVEEVPEELSEALQAALGKLRTQFNELVYGVKDSVVGEVKVQ